MNGKTYSVTVVAKNANGTGTASPKISVTLPDVDPPPTTTTTAPPLGGAGSDDDNDGPGTTVPTRSGYWLLDTTGVVYPFGDAAPYGDPAAKLAAASVPGVAVRAVDLEPTPSMKGYWVLDNRGRIHPFRRCLPSGRRRPRSALRWGRAGHPLGHPVRARATGSSPTGAG